MNLSKSFLILALFFSLFSVSFLSVAVQDVSAQEVKVAVLRGYRAGYSDGYMSGYRDSLENATKSYEKHDEYSRADRAYNKDYGTIEEYRDGYQQGFESGYNTGYEKRSFDATVPANLNRRGTIAAKTTVETPTTNPIVESKPVEPTPVETVAVAPAVEKSAAVVAVETNAAPQVEQPIAEKAVENKPAAPAISDNESALPVISAKPEYVNTAMNRADSTTIPVETELIIELLDDVNTERSREGDKFQARIISPNEIGGAIIEGRVGKIQKPGRIKRRAEVSLSFDRIILPGNRWGNFNAILTEVLPVKGDNVKRIDTEGTIEGRSSVKSDSIKVGAATGTGLVIGAVAGGPVGAAVGAGVGAAFGVGGVVIERGRHIRLGKNQQLRIKTAYETQIR